MSIHIAADRSLRTTVGLWLAVTAIGQWVFLYCIVAVYGVSTVSGNFQAWNTNPFLRKGYVAGDHAGNFAFAAHVMLAAIIAFGGVVQLVPQIRSRLAAVHRWNGRLFLVAATAASVAGLYMVWVRGASGGASNAAAITLNAVLVLAFAALAWRAAAARDFATHRRWALRTFMVANGVFFLRLGFTALMVLAPGQIGPALGEALDFGCYLVPLAVLELYLRVADRGGSVARSAMAVAVLGITAFMGLGIVAFYGFMAHFVLARL